MRTFDEIMWDVSTYLPSPLFEELALLIVEETAIAFAEETEILSKKLENLDLNE